MNHWPGESRKSDTVEAALARHKEKCALRLARIFNGAEPEMQNDPEVLTEDAKRVLGLER